MAHSSFPHHLIRISFPLSDGRFYHHFVPFFKVFAAHYYIIAAGSTTSSSQSWKSGWIMASFFSHVFLFRLRTRYRCALNEEGIALSFVLSTAKSWPENKGHKMGRAEKGVRNRRHARFHILAGREIKLGRTTTPRVLGANWSLIFNATTKWGGRHIRSDESGSHLEKWCEKLSEK